MKQGNNTLGGSLPVGLLNNTFTNFDIYGNELSDLDFVDNYEICDAGGGEVYCDCGSDCFVKKFQCECDRAQSCCEKHYANLPPPCILCESLRVKNPDYYVAEYDVTCQGAFDYIRANHYIYGDEETCTASKVVFASRGCLCDDDAPPGNPETEVMRDSVGI